VEKKKRGRKRICETRQKLIKELRKKGLSYRQIEKAILVSRMTAWRYINLYPEISDKNLKEEKG